LEWSEELDCMEGKSLAGVAPSNSIGQGATLMRVKRGRSGGGGTGGQWQGQVASGATDDGTAHDARRTG
jgi:hypothetical protein